MKKLMEIVEAVNLNGTAIELSDHHCFSDRRSGKSRRADVSLSDETADDSTIMDDNCDVDN